MVERRPNARPVATIRLTFPVIVIMRRHSKLSLAALLLALTFSVGNASELQSAHHSIEALASFDALANVHGGIDRGIEVPSVLELIGESSWSSTSALRHTLKVNLQTTFGGAFSAERSGDIQAVSSVDAANTAVIFEAWYRLETSDGRLSALVGLHDLNSEFYVLERASVLLNGSFGNGPEIAQASPSIFPTSAFGGVVAARIGALGYLRLGAYDGIPGDPSDPYGTHVSFNNGDGVFSIVETGITLDRYAIPAKAAIGLWHSSAEFNDFDAHIRDSNAGLYVIAEAPLMWADEARPLGFFFQFGLTRASRNMIDSYYGAGIHWHDPFERQTDDAFSFGVAHARLAGAYRRTNAITSSAETAIEISYAWRINPYLVVQPDLQFVLSPVGAASAADATVLGARIVIAID